MKTLEEIAVLIEGELAGPGDMPIEGINSLSLAGPSEISFAVGAHFRDEIGKSKAGAVILPKDWQYPVDRPAIKVKDPYVAYAVIAAAFTEGTFDAIGISSNACIGDGCSIPDEVSIYNSVCIGDRVSIGLHATIYPGVYIGDDVWMGEGCTIYPNAVIYKGCRLGNRVTVHAGTVIGSDGFGYARRGDEYIKIPQTGIVVIEDDVEIGANVTIDRAAFGETRICRGTKIDNLVQVGHNVTVGPNSVIVAQAGISGSCKLGAGVMLGGQAGLSGHIELGDSARVGAKSGVSKGVPAGETVSGIPAIPHRQWLRAVNVFKKLPEMEREMRQFRTVLNLKAEDLGPEVLLDAGGQDERE